MGDPNDYHHRTCVRCGRVGSSAFRPAPTDAGRSNWVCSHSEPCIARMRSRHRAGARRLEGRPPTSPIAPGHLSERPAAVIGSDRESVATLAAVLGEFAAIEVDDLDQSRRSLGFVARRDYGLIVIDAHFGDSVAFVNELRRRLALRRADRAFVVCHDPGPLSPAIEALAANLDAACIGRPFDALRFMHAVTTAAEGEPAAAVS